MVAIVPQNILRGHSEKCIEGAWYEIRDQQVGQRGHRKEKSQKVTMSENVEKYLVSQQH